MKKELELNNIDISLLIKTIDSCTGNVFLESPEGDRFNLKSKLSQFAGIATLIQGGIIAHAVIKCDNPEDESKLFRLNLYREVPESK